ncbi:shikimate kinase AroL [Orbaceae bacterium ac157xtp]
MNTTLFLIGARASGKTTIGKALAKALNYTFVDCDAYLLESTGKSVAEIVTEKGWDGFRRQESEILKEVTQPKRVIATGGGIVLTESNREFMRKNGTVIFLSVPAARLAERLTLDPKQAQRPSLTGQPINIEIENILKERLPLYSSASHYAVDADKNSDEIISNIKQLLEKK